MRVFSKTVHIHATFSLWISLRRWEILTFMASSSSSGTWGMVSGSASSGPWKVRSVRGMYHLLSYCWFLLREEMGKDGWRWIKDEKSVENETEAIQRKVNCYSILTWNLNQWLPDSEDASQQVLIWPPMKCLTLRSVSSVWRRAADRWRGRRAAASSLPPPTPPWSCPSEAGGSAGNNRQGRWGRWHKAFGVGNSAFGDQDMREA